MTADFPLRDPDQGRGRGIASCRRRGIRRPPGRIFAGIALGAAMAAASGRATPASPADIVWKLDNTGSIGGHPTLLVGAPRIVREAGGGQVRFDGKSDGLIVLSNPLAGWRNFTVEVLFKPDADGLPEPRFIHLEDEAGRRMTFELRLTNGKQWALDAFLTTGPSSRQLLDRKRLHSADRWHWAAIVYDGDHGRMASFVDGREELSGSLAFTPMVSGRMGIGFRLNHVYWYKGEIREIRFHPKALSADFLARSLPPQ